MLHSVKNASLVHKSIREFSMTKLAGKMATVNDHIHRALKTFCNEALRNVPLLLRFTTF